jgi:two-component system LytT family sensor kinase
MSRPSIHKREFLFAAIVWWAILGIIYSVMLTSVLKKFPITFLQIVVDAFVNNLFLTACWILIINNMRYYLPRREKYWYILFISVAMSAVSIGLSRLLLGFIFAHDTNYPLVLAQTIGFRFGISFLLIACMAVVSLLWYTQQEEKANDERKVDAEKLSREAELFKLKQQLQPHFLFNSLNSISALVGTRPEEARRMIQQLSDFLRGTIKKEEQQFVPLEEELQHLQLYLDIEKVRFGHRLETSIESKDETIQLKLPSLLLQPIVENAIKFGLYDTVETVVIKICAVKENNQLVITVQNPFDPQTAFNQKGSGFGLSSVKRRLYLLFARKDLLTTEATENIFTTTLKIPQIV